MDYLTVPPKSTLPAGEGLPPGAGQAPSSTMAELVVPSPPSPEASTILSVTPGKRLSHRPASKQTSPKTRKGLRIHRQKQKRKNLKEHLRHFWSKVKPKLVLLRRIIFTLSQHIYFEIYIFSMVGINTFILVAQTFAVVEIRGEWFFSAMDPIFLNIYVMEAILKIIALDVEYFRDFWNDLDFFIMLMTVLDFVLSLNMYRNINQFNSIKTFRILRICKGIRAIRAVRYILTLRLMKNLKEAASTFALSAKSIGAILLLMLTFLCMFAVVLHDIFRTKDPKHFGDIFNTIFTLFQFLTLDDWSLVYLTCRAAGAWYIIFFLIVYILVEYFLLLNLVIAVLVDNFQMGLVRRKELLKQKQKQKLLKETSEMVPPPEAEKVTAWAQSAEKATGSEEDIKLFKETVTEKYGSLELTNREWQLLYSYFQAMMAIETTQQQFYSQAATSDKIVDTFFETAVDEDSPE